MKKVLCYIFLLSFLSCGSGGDAEVAQATTAAKTTTPTAPKVQVNKPVQKKPVIQRNNKPQPKQPEGPYKAKNEGWGTNLEDAYNQSKKTGRPILANFTGSDWCGWCKRLDKSVFHKDEFKSWAKKNVVLLELDFPRRFKVPEEVAVQNRSLQQSFGVRGYPTIWLFDVEKDAAGKYNIDALGKTGYTKTVEEFTSTMNGYMASRK